jgi:hypothetical protein
MPSDPFTSPQTTVISVNVAISQCDPAFGVRRSRKCNRADQCAAFAAAELGNTHCGKLPHNWHYTATPHALSVTLQRV